MVVCVPGSLQINEVTLTIFGHPRSNLDIRQCFDVLVLPLSPGTVLVPPFRSQTQSARPCNKVLALRVLVLQESQGLVVMLHEDIKVNVEIEGMRIDLFHVHNSLVFLVVKVLTVSKFDILVL